MTLGCADLGHADLGHVDLGEAGSSRQLRSEWVRPRRRPLCAKNAASSAFSAIPTPPRSPRSDCTRSSIAGRRPPASSPSTASASIPSAASASSATISRAPPRSNACPATSAIGHVRYSTTGETILRNVQPLFAELDSGGFAVAHNGNLTNGLTLRRELIRDGAIYQSTSDTEVDPSSRRPQPPAAHRSSASSRRCASSKAPIRWSP